MDRATTKKDDTESISTEEQSVKTIAGNASSESTAPHDRNWSLLTQELLEWCIEVVDATRQTLSYLRQFKVALTELEPTHFKTDPESAPADPRDGVFVSFHCARFYNELARLKSLFNSPERIPSYWQGATQIDVLFTNAIDYELMAHSCAHVALANHAHLRPKRFRGSCSVTCAELVVCNFESVQRDLLSIRLWPAPGRNTFPTSERMARGNRKVMWGTIPQRTHIRRTEIF